MVYNKEKNHKYIRERIPEDRLKQFVEDNRKYTIEEHRKEMHDMIDELYKRADECQDKMDNMYYDGKEDGLREAIEIIKSKLC